MGGNEAGGERKREKGTVAWWSTKEGRGLLLGTPGESEGHGKGASRRGDTGQGPALQRGERDSFTRAGRPRRAAEGKGQAGETKPKEGEWRRSLRGSPTGAWRVPLSAPPRCPTYIQTHACV